MKNGLITSLLLLPHLAFSQLVTTPGTASTLVQNVLLGSGVTVSGIAYTGSAGSIGSFDGTNTNLGIGQGVIITTGTISDNGSGPHGPNNQSSSGVDNNLPGDLDLEFLIGGISTHDASVLEFDFIPYSDTVRFRYVFASEEYPEYVDSQYNDGFAFFISGPGISGTENIAKLPNGLPVAINNVNNGQTNSGPCTNCAYYVNNGNGSSSPQDGSSFYLQYDGFTTVLEAMSKVQCGQTYHLKIVVADVGDGIFDSGIFLEANSLTALAPVTGEVTLSADAFGDDVTMAEGCTGATVTLTRNGGDLSAPMTVPVTVAGTATQGSDYTGVPTSVTFAANQSQLQFNVNALVDVPVEGEETIIISFMTTSPCGNNIPVQVTLKINEIPPLSAEIEVVGMLCEGQSVQVTGNVVGGNGGPYTYLWSTGETTPTITVSSASAQTIDITLVVTEPGPCGSSDTTEESLVFQVFQGGILTTAATICPGTPYQLSAFGGTTYAWTPQGVLDNPASPTPYATIDSPTTFTCVITSDCGETTSQVTLDVFDIEVDFPEDTSCCSGESVALATSGFVSASWVPSTFLSNAASPSTVSSPTTSITYAITGITVEGCQVTGTVDLDVKEPMPDPQIADTLTYCLGSSGSVKVGGASSYSWSPTNNIFPLTGAVVTISTTNEGYYYCDFTTTCSTIRDSIYISLKSLSITAEGDTTICPGGQAKLSAFSADTYDWWPAVNSSLNNNSVVFATPLVNTLYTVVGTDAIGCRDTANVLVNLYPEAFVKAKLLDFAFYGEPVSIAAEATGVGSFLWSPADFVSCPACPVTTVNASHNLDLTVTFTDQNGCKDDDQLRVEYRPLVFIPNTFTPDGNNFNNDFFAVSANVTAFQIEIFNRWGELVYDGTGTDVAWDGTYKGKSSPDGTYTWRITYTDVSNKSYVETGHVNLMH